MNSLVYEFQMFCLSQPEREVNEENVQSKLDVSKEVLYFS